MAYYLETGAILIRYLLQGRRILFLLSLLQKSEDELARKVYNAHKEFRVKDVWILDLKTDLDDFGKEFDEEKISKMKKETFKKLVCEKIREFYHSKLLEEKDGKNMSKLAWLTSHYGMKEYLSSEKLNLDEKRLLFQLRTRMVEVRTNYKNKYGDNLNCTHCQS